MEPDSTWIEDLLKNNYPPSNEEAQKITRLLLEPSKELEVLQSEMMDLKKRLSELESRQNEIKKRIARYEIILSPIRRVPPDVLGEIFYHCLPAHRNPIMASSDCPLLLTRVCSTWRSTAMTTPKLWDRLYITFTDEDTVPDFETLSEMAQNGMDINGWRYAQPKSAKERMMDLLRKKCEAVREWFLRSGTRPLSISLHFAIVPWYNVPYSQRQPGVSKALLSLLASLAPRWKRFEVKSSLNLFTYLENMLPVSQMLAFTSLRADFPPHYYLDPHEDAKKTCRLFNAPNIRQLSMSIIDPTLAWGLDNRVVQWNKFTHITCLCPLSLADTAFLLKHSSNLVHYKGSIFQYNNSPNLHAGPISLPFLQSFSITDTLHPSVVAHLYDHIDAPKLQWITYVSESSNVGYSVNNPAPIHILPLLRRSTKLRYLCVDAIDLNIWELGAMLRAVPSIDSLVIGKEDTILIPGEVLVSTFPFRDYDASLREVWKFSELVVGTSSNPPLLPRLTSLVISSITAQISDDTLFELVKSRMRSPRTATLRHVKGRFCRAIQRLDIVEELMRYSESVDIEIHLDLLYAKRPPPKVGATVPFFGMDGRDGQSWKYEDAGDRLTNRSWYTTE